MGAWLPGSGFTRVLHNVLAGLASTHEVHLLGIGYRGPVAEIAGGVTLHPTNLHGGDVFGAFRAVELAREREVRLVLLLNDLWMLHGYMRTLPQLRRTAALVAYVPLDGRIVSTQVLEPLAAIHRFVASTEFGRRELAGGLERLGRPSEVAVIPHGTDASVFRPLPGGRADARRRLFAGEPEWERSFIVLNANRPHERKRIDLTLEGFARFAADKPSEVKLWLHHAHMDPEQRDAILALAASHGIADRLRVTELGAAPLSDAELNLVYNACEVGVNSAMGEGWGMVSFEHAATGAAQIVPDSSACAELWEGAAELVTARDTGVPRFSMLAMSTVSAEGIAGALERLYSDPARRRALAGAAYRNATQVSYGWGAISERWRRLLEELVP